MCSKNMEETGRTSIYYAKKTKKIYNSLLDADIYIILISRKTCIKYNHTHTHTHNQIRTTSKKNTF